eukprot:scaffold3917_cov377-Prasinococcus_capsulatus_cf.AAC.3
MSLDGTPCFLFIRGDGWSWKIVERVNGFSFEALEMLIEAQIAPGASNPFASSRSLAGGAVGGAAIGRQCMPAIGVVARAHSADSERHRCVVDNSAVTSGVRRA